MMYVAFAPASKDFDPLTGSDLNVFSQMHRFSTAARLLDKFVIIPLLKALQVAMFRDPRFVGRVAQIYQRREIAICF